ncbi:terminase small subunit [bacterium]|nr:terminase small subunit [bacterium]
MQIQNKKVIVNATELAEFLRIANTTVTRYRDDGMPFIHKGTRGTDASQYDLKQCLHWFFDAETDITKEKIRKLQLECAEIELGLKIKNGEYIKTAEILSDMENDYTIVRTRLLSLPNKITPELIQITDEFEFKEKLTQEIREILEQLANGIAT